MTKESQQFDKMVNTPVKKLVITLGIPTIISMLITAIYNIADTFFVSQLGKAVSGAVSVVFPLQAVIQAIGFTLGMGGGSVISSLLGQKKDKEAQEVGSSSFYLALILGLLICAISLIFMNPLLELLGATENGFVHAKNYAKYIVIGAPIMTGSFVLNNLLRSEGKSKLAMIGLTVGGLLNIGLDPLLINTFDMGISGAAIATLTSQIISFSILLSMFIFKKSIIKLSPYMISKEFTVYSEILKVGFPSFCRQAFVCLATILLNNQASKYGEMIGPEVNDAAQSAMGIVGKIVTVIFTVSLGIGQGYQPVCGYNYHSKRYERVKEATLFTFYFMTIVMIFLSTFFFIFAENVMNLFIDDEMVVKFGVKALRWQCFAMPFVSINTICNMTYQSTKQKVKAVILSCCRQGIFFIPLILLLPLFIGLDGVIVSQSIADLITCIFSIFFFISLIREINYKIEQTKSEIELV